LPRLASRPRSQTVKASPRPHSVEAAAETLGISVRTVRTEIARGRLQAVKIGARLLIYPTQIEAYRATLPAAHFKS
jgi:excisionase family DNA binding protein